ncbi:conjugative transposon protein TraJ [Pedobacter ginsengisoli]|uniref:Conjugative transposon protein TraJ n=1 Tax=Pedobacter ginsengisoli TaxID=363852 RepID=A0A2D1U733_9SPHI|nr:conjugative transposon protein TraJ [Pedobacter ginsengisoli]ATP57419.1 conjugative transposon protein TraJ [Pedobacter ginsengisoli]
MNKATKRLALLFLLLLPAFCQAQGLAQEMNSLHEVLDQLYLEMMPLCSKLIGVAQGIAGFAALWYIGSRVWRHIANAEAINFYPLFRPFVLGFAIMIYPLVLSMINGIMKPTVTATAEMMNSSNQAIAKLLKAKERQVKASDAWKMYVGSTGEGDRDKWYKYTYDNQDPAAEGILDGLGNEVRFAMSKASYNFRNSVKEWMSEILRVVYEAAALCINTLRTFNLVVMAILGPLVFGIAVFDGFQNTLSSWLARYLNIFLWLPVANIFGSIISKVQEKMLILDIGEIQQNGDTLFSSTDTAYLIFLLIGIVGYFTVPSVAGYIVNAGGAGAMTQQITSMVSGAAAGTTAIASAGASKAASGVQHVAGATLGLGSDRGTGGSPEKGNSYLHDKILGT